MRYVRILGCCVMTAMAVAAFVATSASALPEFGQCVPEAKHEGKYTEGGCVKKAKLILKEEKKVGTGEFEWRKASELPATERKLFGEGGASVLKTNFELCEGGSHSGQNVSNSSCTEGGGTVEHLPVSVECAKEKNFTEISPATNEKEVRNVAVVFNKCIALGVFVCQNTAESGEIKVDPLKGKLGYLNKAATPREVGLLLEPAVKGEFARFDCGAVLGTHVGVAKATELPAYPTKGGGDGIISPITPVNTMSSEFTQVYSMNEAEGPQEDENIPSKLEGTAPLKVLEDWTQNPSEPEVRSKWSKAGEATTNIEKTCTAELACESPSEVHPGEIKAN